MAVTQTEKLVQPCRRAAAVRAPGLDGLRALAVLAVLIFHQNIAIVPAGFLGVDVFFVLSGYLITDLLAGQWEAGRRIDLRGFWVRRARRLLPALAVMLLVVTAAVAVIARPGPARSGRPCSAR
jgi:peptidoglycan/LPS O-acetylase OafA/YrhL